VVFAIALGDMVEGLKGEVISLRQDNSMKCRLREEVHGVLSRLSNGSLQGRLHLAPEHRRDRRHR